MRLRCWWLEYCDITLVVTCDEWRALLCMYVCVCGLCADAECDRWVEKLQHAVGKYTSNKVDLEIDTRGKFWKNTVEIREARARSRCVLRIVLSELLGGPVVVVDIPFISIPHPNGFDVICFMPASHGGIGVTCLMMRTLREMAMNILQHLRLGPPPRIPPLPQCLLACPLCRAPPPRTVPMVTALFRPRPCLPVPLRSMRKNWLVT